MIAARNGVDVEDVIASIAAFEAMVAAAKVTLVDFSGGGSQAAAPQPDAPATTCEPLCLNRCTPPHRTSPP